MRNSFIVQFGVGLWLTSIGVSGFLAGPLGWIASWVLGTMLDKGILLIDLSLSSLKVALEEDQYKDAAKKAYDHAQARVYTEEEKNAIRKEYLAALSRFASVGNGLPN